MRAVRASVPAPAPTRSPILILAGAAMAVVAVMLGLRYLPSPFGNTGNATASGTDLVAAAPTYPMTISILEIGAERIS